MGGRLNTTGEGLLVTLDTFGWVPLREQNDGQVVNGHDRRHLQSKWDEVGFVVEIEPAEPGNGMEVRGIGAASQSECQSARQSWWPWVSEVPLNRSCVRWV